MRSLHISLNTTYSECKPSSSISSFTHSLQVFLPLPTISLLPPPHFYRPTPHHLHSYIPHAQTTSIHHALPPQPHSEPPINYINPHCTSYPSATPCTSISPSSVPSSPDFADLKPSSPRSQSYMTIQSGHKPCIPFPLCGMMHPELSW